MAEEELKEEAQGILHPSPASECVLGKPLGRRRTSLSRFWDPPDQQMVLELSGRLDEWTGQGLAGGSHQTAFGQTQDPPPGIP